MPEITVTTTVTFDPEKFWRMSDFIWASTYLAEPMEEIEDGPGDPELGVKAQTLGIRVVTWKNADAPHEGTEVHEVSWQQLGEAIAHLAVGTFTNHAGDEVEPLAYHVTAAASITRGDESGFEWDSETEDLILQQAVFGKVIYG